MFLDGIYQQNIYVYDVNQSKGNANLAMVAVIDGRKFPFSTACNQHKFLSASCILYLRL